MPTKPVSVIFVVDDETIIAESLAIILRKSGFVAFPFSNPAEALERAKAEAPDLLLTDVVMPQFSGIDLAIQIKAFCPACRILLFSGQASTKDLLQNARKFGHHFQLLSKPIHPADLMRKITEQDEDALSA